VLAWWRRHARNSNRLGFNRAVSIVGLDQKLDVQVHGSVGVLNEALALEEFIAILGGKLMLHSLWKWNALFVEKATGVGARHSLGH